MSEFNTGNAVPSTDPRDVDDNATVFDKLLNTETPSVPDRLSVLRKTWWQMEQDAEALVSPNVAALAALVLAADRLIYATGAGALALTTFTSFARTLLDDPDAATVRATLGLGSTNSLTALGALTPAADRLPYFTSGSAASVATLTAYARTLLDDVDAATARATLGLGAAAVAAILGTVSQTAGVPTGAIVETGGSIAGTGLYTKWADGTMRIVKSLSVASGSTVAKGSIFGSTIQAAGSFPVAFVGAVPVVQNSGTDSGGGGWTALEVSPTLTSWGSYSLKSALSSGASGVINLTADGRWF